MKKIFKTKILITATALFLLSAGFAVAQDKPAEKAPQKQKSAASAKKTSKKPSYDVGGLQLGKRATQEEIIKAFGVEPSNYTSWALDEGLGEEYQFNSGKDVVRFEGRRGLVHFSIKTKNVSLFGGLVKVGDNIGNLYKIQGVKLKDRNESEYEIIPASESDDFGIFVTHDGGTITNINGSFWD